MRKKDKNRIRLKRFYKKCRLRSKRLAKRYGDWILIHNAWNGKIDKRDKWLGNAYDAFQRSGWSYLWHMCLEEINEEVHKNKYLEKNFYFVEIKEKYGEIRAYTNFFIDEIERIIDNYSFISRNVCQQCGKPDSSISNGYWIDCTCRECYEKYWKKYWESKEHKSYEEVYDTDPEHTIIPNVRTVRHFDKSGEWVENIDISETVNKVREVWNKKRERRKK